MRSYVSWSQTAVRESVKDLAELTPPELIDALSWFDVEIRWMNLGVLVVSHREVAGPLAALMGLDPNPSSGGWLEPPRRIEMVGGDTAWVMKASFKAYGIELGRESRDWRLRCVTARRQLTEGILS